MPIGKRVYRDNVDRLYRLMSARVGNRPDAEDLTAEVFPRRTRPATARRVEGRGTRLSTLMTARTVLASHWRQRLGQPVTFLDPATDMELLSESPAADSLGSKGTQRRRKFSQRSRNGIAGSSSSASSRRLRSKKRQASWT